MFCLSRLCLLLILHQAVSLKSYRSPINENGRPVLRTVVDDDNISAHNKQTIDPPWLTELRESISHLVNIHGYHDAKPHIQKLVEQTEKSMNVLLHVKGSTSIEVGKSEASFRAKKYKNLKKDIKTDIDPSWLIEFKSFVKALVQSYGWDRTKQMLTHLIKNLEKKHNITIEDVDGEVFVKYSGFAKKSNKKKKKKRVKNWSSEK